MTMVRRQRHTSNAWQWIAPCYRHHWTLVLLMAVILAATIMGFWNWRTLVVTQQPGGGVLLQNNFHQKQRQQRESFHQQSNANSTLLELTELFPLDEYGYGQYLRQTFQHKTLTASFVDAFAYLQHDDDAAPIRPASSNPKNLARLLPDQNVADNTAAAVPPPPPPPCDPASPIYQTLAAAQAAPVTNDTSTCAKLPRLVDFTTVYGDTPIILGMERCAAGQAMPGKVRVGIAGQFNSGTNAVRVLIGQNLHFPQDPWRGRTDTGSQYFALGDTTHELRHENAHRVGNLLASKHILPHSHPAHVVTKMYRDHVLPVIVVRSPWAWMQAMCKAPYNVYRYATTNHSGVVDDGDGDGGHRALPPIVRCPELLQWRNSTSDGAGAAGANPYVRRPHQVTLKVPKFQVDETYDTILHLWIHYHDEWLRAPYPRLLVRYEDTIFRGDQVMAEMAACLGPSRVVQAVTPFQPVATPAKQLGQSLGLLAAMIKVMSPAPVALRPEEWAYAHALLSRSAAYRLLQYPGDMMTTTTTTTASQE